MLKVLWLVVALIFQYYFLVLAASRTFLCSRGVYVRLYAAEREEWFMVSSFLANEGFCLRNADGGISQTKMTTCFILLGFGDKVLLSSLFLYLRFLWGFYFFRVYWSAAAPTFASLSPPFWKCFPLYVTSCSCSAPSSLSPPLSHLPFWFLYILPWLLLSLLVCCLPVHNYLFILSLCHFYFLVVFIYLSFLHSIFGLQMFPSLPVLIILVYLMRMACVCAGCTDHRSED